jgi:hypothetical protein
VFLYVERFCDDVQQNHLSLDRPEQFPQGLGGIFCQWFQRQFPDLEKFRKDVRPALRVILAARAPLPVKILQRRSNWQEEELRNFTHTLGSLFPVTKESTGEGIKPCHKSLADWLADEGKAGAHFVSVLEGHRMLAELGWREFADKADHLPEFFMRHPAFDLSRSAMRLGCLLYLRVLRSGKEAPSSPTNPFTKDSPSFYLSHARLMPLRPPWNISRVVLQDHRPSESDKPYSFTSQAWCS